MIAHELQSNPQPFPLKPSSIARAGVVLQDGETRRARSDTRGAGGSEGDPQQDEPEGEAEQDGKLRPLLQGTRRRSSRVIQRPRTTRLAAEVRGLPTSIEGEQHEDEHPEGDLYPQFIWDEFHLVVQISNGPHDGGSEGISLAWQRLPQATALHLHEARHG